MTHIVNGPSPNAAPDPARSGVKPEQPSRATGTDRAAKPRPRGRSRDPFFDNTKFLAIILVVVGHVIEDLRDIEALHALYLFIYLFHMPVFIVITGYFSRTFIFSGGKAQKLITNLAVPYVVFELAYSTYHWAVDGADFEITLLDPYYLTWFLMALFAWRLSAPVWQQIRWPLGVAVAISLASGMNELPRELELNRILGMLPFFVLGLMLKPEHFEWLKRPAARIIGASTMVVGIIVAFIVHHRMTTEWAYWRHGNDWLNVDDITGSVMRLGLLACSAALVAAFLALVPTRHTWYTAFGSLTLYAYLLHGFMTKGMEYMGWWDAEWMRTPLGLPTVLIVTCLLALALMTQPVRWCTKWALEPRMPWAFMAPRRPRSKVHQGAHRAPEQRTETAAKAPAGQAAQGSQTAQPARHGPAPGPAGTAPAAPAGTAGPTGVTGPTGPAAPAGSVLDGSGGATVVTAAGTSGSDGDSEKTRPDYFKPGPAAGGPDSVTPAPAPPSAPAPPAKSAPAKPGAPKPPPDPGDSAHEDPADTGPHRGARPPYGLSGWPQPHHDAEHKPNRNGRGPDAQD